MEFFDKLGKKASAAYKVTADKTGKIAKDTKNKLKMSELKSQISDLYEEIGKKVYEKYVREENIDIKSELNEECTKIDVLSDEINVLLKQCLELKDKKQCPKCFKEMDKEDKFCPNCGEKQTEEPPKEVEILEDVKDAEVKEDNEKEKQIVEEELQNDIKEKEDSMQNSEGSQDGYSMQNNEGSQNEDSMQNDEGSQKEDNMQNSEGSQKGEEFKENLEKTVEVESAVDEVKPEN